MVFNRSGDNFPSLASGPLRKRIERIPEEPLTMKEIRSWVALAVVFGGMIFQMGRLSNQVDNITQKVAEIQQDLKTFVRDTDQRRERGIQQ